MTDPQQRRLFSILVAIFALIPVAAGLAGLLLGPRFLGVQAPWPADLGSHFRFLSGIFLAMGVVWWSCLADLQNTRGRFRLLALLTICGGLARLVSLFVDGQPSLGHLGGLVMELSVVPLLTLWHFRLFGR
ncbi:DUF4345 domain-containing protein [Tianweitania populi]|uniref:DUF4345 domain-containing protein n=1 Tax=Tianweitania populi TaxID=1607949 RepID=A0A8J3DWI9_9HYPH|nr:DUF4345 domain-containing protein [Tianweitania populi]GHD19570.1 hypothetical protein GCM10016234_31420 [Tianweitania populi]